MSEVERAFHETWLGMVQPVEGLVVSLPVLLDKECFERHPPALQHQFKALCTRPAERTRRGDDPAELCAHDLPRFFAELLGLTPDLWDAAPDYRRGEAWAGVVPETVSVYAAEGGQTLRPSLALRRQGAPAARSELDGEAARAAAVYELLVWELPLGLSLDKAEAVTGPWHYPPTAKFERVLRAAKVPIGLLSNAEAFRLVYAPHGEAAGHLDFRIADMAQVGGRPILDALVTLLHAKRFFAVAEDRALPAILADSRKYQTTVTNELGAQVFDALTILLRGFEAAAERDPKKLVDEALAREDDALTQGLLTVLLRIVFVLFAEDRGLLPVEHPLYAEHYSVFALYERLLADHGAFPDSMARRYGAWGQLIALFRALYQGVSHAELKMPERRGDLFNPHRFAFLEGWDPEGASPLRTPKAQAEVKLPTLDDETVFLVLSKLIMLDGQRLSYRALDVEQIGSVYEGLMGNHAQRVASDAVRMRPDGVWLTVEEVLAVAPARREAFLADHVNLPKAQAKKLAAAMHGMKSADKAHEALLEYAMGRTKEARGTSTARAGQLVLQPGPERRRTSSHYTPRSLSSKVVEHALEPLMRCMTPAGAEGPPSERILQLRVCDPAMGSGAFLVEACRYLGDALVAAWTREGKVGHHPDPVLAARRRIAQCCLYGVDKNPAAVELAKLSLWLVTLAKQRPFTFLDGALRHGDSLVGLDMEQIRAFHWKPSGQRTLAEVGIDRALSEAVEARHKLHALAQKENGVNPDWRDKTTLLRDAEDALGRLKLIADVCLGAFFACDSDRDREQERLRRRDLVETWLASEGGKAEKLEAELRKLQAELWKTQTPFHWMLEFPDVFWDKRDDPLEDGAKNGVAHMDAFVGNPPFSGKNGITEQGGEAYLPWLLTVHDEAHGNSDLSAHFFRRVESMLGRHGTIGLIATNTIGQGDTRTTGLQWLVGEGLRIYRATTNMPWPGDTAAVTVSIVHLSKGLPQTDRAVLDEQACATISSQLSADEDRGDPSKLETNASSSFQGSIVLGKGFVLTPAERSALVARSRRNAQRIFPYLGGEEVNTSPDQAFDRYVISFGQMSLEEAEQWPDLLAIVREKVKPERDKLRDNADGRRRRLYWWQHGRWTPALYTAIAPLARCIVTSRVTKHLVFSFQPGERIFSEQLYVFPFHTHTPFAVMQSRVHEAWARLLSSTMEDRLRYAASDCFETFPFPQPDPRTVLPKLEKLGEQLYVARAQYMHDTQQGLTKTYNALKDPSCSDPRVIKLREQHETMDAAVLREYGWDNVPGAPFCAKTDDDRRAQETFKRKVIDLLYELNAQRAREEQGHAANDNDKGKSKAARASQGPGVAKASASAKGRKKASGGTR
jgi:hypothetical protein